jgi:hypothetical protein
MIRTSLSSSKVLIESAYILTQNGGRRPAFGSAELPFTSSILERKEKERKFDLCPPLTPVDEEVTMSLPARFRGKCP